jgi:hypothetical protein
MRISWAGPGGCDASSNVAASSCANSEFLLKMRRALGYPRDALIDVSQLIRGQPFRHVAS